jgi:hypothetical protein
LFDAEAVPWLVADHAGLDAMFLTNSLDRMDCCVLPADAWAAALVDHPPKD